MRTKRQETGEGALVDGEAARGSRDSIMKQVSNSVQAAASGRDPDSHQSIAVWWFLTKEVQGKNSSGGDLIPASWGIVTAWLIYKKGNKLISSHVDPKTHHPLPALQPHTHCGTGPFALYWTGEGLHD